MKQVKENVSHIESYRRSWEQVSIGRKAGRLVCGHCMLIGLLCHCILFLSLK